MNTQIRVAIRHWPRVAPALEPPRSKTDCRRPVEALAAVPDADESHPLARLVDYLGDLMAEHEAAHKPMKEMPPREFLRELWLPPELEAAVKTRREPV